MDFGNFFQTIVSGGPAMWALLLLSIVAVAIVIERLFFFATQHSDSKSLLRQLGQKIAADDLTGAMQTCQANKGMLPRILEFGLARGEKNRADITDALSIALMENLNALERNLGIIGTIAVPAPATRMASPGKRAMRSPARPASTGGSVMRRVPGGDRRRTPR